MNVDQTRLIRRLDALGIHDTSAGSSDETGSTPLGPVDVVREGEEGVARADNSRELLHVRLLLLGAQCLGDRLEQALPLRSLAALGRERLASHKEVDGVGLVSSLRALFEWQVEHSRVVSQPPVVGLVTGKTGAVDSRLLARAETDDGAVERVTDRVGLRVLERERSDDQVGDGLVRHLE